MTVTVTYCADPTELYRHYAGQHEAQDAYIELDLRAEGLHASYNAEIGNAVPFSVHHGFERRYPIPTLTAEAANRVMEDIIPLATRVVEDWEQHWDGNNLVASLGDDARAAEEEIELLLGVDLDLQEAFDSSDLVQEWDIEGATNGDEVSEYDITSTTSDERLEEIADSITQDLAGVGESAVVVVDGLQEHLRRLRDELAEEDAEEEPV